MELSHWHLGGVSPNIQSEILLSVTLTWEEYLTLDVGISYHVSWTQDPNFVTFLMGGGKSEARNTTFRIKPEHGLIIMFVIVKITEVAQVRLMSVYVYCVMEVEKEVDLMALYLSSLQTISSPAHHLP